MTGSYRVLPRAERLRVDFILTANDRLRRANGMSMCASPARTAMSLRATSPRFFDYRRQTDLFGGTRIDYQNKDLEVGLYYNGAGITSGTYRVEVYMDGYMIGTTEAYPEVIFRYR